MKFDFVIGNPPYQEETVNNGRQMPVYNRFMEETYKVADCVELITLARFLFNAGQTPKAWNAKMLNDKHFKVIYYEPNASKIFPITDIKGGVAITIRDVKKDYGKIGVFTEFKELNTILHKIMPTYDMSIADVSIGAVPYRYTEVLRKERPEYVDLAGESYDLRTNALDKLGDKIFFEEKPDDEIYIKIHGLRNKKRACMFVNEQYIDTPINFKGYKVLLSKASGSGKFGEALSRMIISEPYSGHTQSFISVGNFDTKREAESAEKYIKSKFARTLLGVLKTTQDLTPDKFKYVPLQDFTESSDIDWSQSVADIDQQLYKKYGLSSEEIDFIETHVKEMK